MKSSKNLRAHRIESDAESKRVTDPTLVTLRQLCESEPALRPGGVRNLLFYNGHDLPGVYRFGRKILFDRKEFMEGIKQGCASQISGRSAR